tara:strand:- start:544 stop:717 length:174 start_codon:yes stop_codon:yes gene_type:complete
MPKYRVTATMDYGYVAVIEASTKDEAWQIAKEGDGDWVKADTGHDWTVETIMEVKDG